MRLFSKLKKNTSEKLEIIYKDFENRLKNSLGTKVSFRPQTKSKGKIVIEYFNSDELEINLFERQLYKEMCVQTDIKLPKTLKEFKESHEKKYDSIILRTSNTHFSYLITLAHVHYQTDLFPDFLNLGFWKPMQEGDNVKKEQ